MMLPGIVREEDRAVALRDAQQKAAALFERIERDLIRPGLSESALSQEIHALAAAMFGVKNHWHKRVIRTGVNTLQPYNEEPPDLVVQDDDILFVDLGPVFAGWEADFGRTYVLGNDPAKHRLRRDLEPVFAAGKAHFRANPDITGAELYAAMCGLAGKAGWQFGGAIAGHLVGEFPHERIPGNKTDLYITRGNDNRLNSLDAEGTKRHWILEVHLVDRDLGIGGFYEDLLTVD